MREADAAVGGLRALPIANPTKETLAEAREHWPVAFFVEMESGSSPSVLEDPTLIRLSAGPVHSRERARRSRLCQGQGFLRGQGGDGRHLPDLYALDPAEMRADSGVTELHPGAFRFFEKQDIE